MTQHTQKPLSPFVYILAGIAILAVVGLALDVILSGSGAVSGIEGPLSEFTTYNFTLLGALCGGLLGAFVGFGLV